MTRYYPAVALVFGLAVATRGAAQVTPCPTPSSTFDLIQRGVFEQHRCTQDFCHGAAKQGGLDLRARTSYENLLPADEQGDTGDEQYKLVAPGRPEESLLWLLLAAKTLGRQNVPGTPMPISTMPLSPDELEGVRLWIAAGAPAGGTVDGVADLIRACPQSTESDSTDLPVCDRNDPSLLLPELRPEPPKDIRVVDAIGNRYIFFSTVIANTGDGPLIIQAAQEPSQWGQVVDAEQVIFRRDGSKCAHRAGAYLYAGIGGTWNYMHMANFALRKDDPMNGELFALRSKAYICLLDTDPGGPSTTAPHQFEAHCSDKIGRMGISAGWKDTYHRVFPGQWIDLDADPNEPVPPGDYYVVNIANPINALWEIDSSVENNTSWAPVRVNVPDPDPPGAQPTPGGQPPTAAPTPALQPTPVGDPTPPDQAGVRARPPRPPRPVIVPPAPPGSGQTTQRARAPRPTRPIPALQSAGSEHLTRLLRPRRPPRPVDPRLQQDAPIHDSGY